MTITVGGQRLKKNLAFIRKGYKVTPECLITRVSREGQITYFRESDYRRTPVTVSVEEFRAKFGGWTESPSLRAQAWRKERELREMINYLHGLALRENLMRDAALQLNVDAEALDAALRDLLDDVRSEGYDEGYRDGRSEGE